MNVAIIKRRLCQVYRAIFYRRPKDMVWKVGLGLVHKDEIEMNADTHGGIENSPFNDIRISRVPSKRTD